MPIIKHIDSISLKDQHKRTNTKVQIKEPIFGLRGWVKVFLNDKLVHEDHNLVVGIGREFVAQRIFNLQQSSSRNWTNYYITHFAVGQGGATLDCSTTPATVTLNGPNGNDEHLYDCISLENTAYLTEPGGVQYACKQINTIVYEQVEVNGTYYYTDVHCTCIVDLNEPANTIVVSEAGLYAVAGTNTLLFAHICFPPKWKQPDEKLTIEWTIRC